MRELVFMYLPEYAPGWIDKWFPAAYPKSIYDSNRQYHQDTVFYYDLYGAYQDTVVEKLAQGYRVIYDAKNEHYVHYDKQWVLDAFLQHPGQGMFLISGHAAQHIPGVTVQATPYWYWITDQINYRYNGYNDYVPAPTNQYKFFMQMSLNRPDRDVLYEKFQPVLHDSMHSYRSQGVFLPNDYTGDGNWQRWMNFDWINQTCFTVSVETYIADDIPTGYSLTTSDNWFLCEKSYKAIAAHHPFLLASTQGNLAYLRSQGFETFPELWDESYDNKPNYQHRIDDLVDIIKQFDQRSWDQRIVKEKLQHNRARFFDQTLTKKFCNETVIDPVLRFAE
jgi:hypothetical protein